MQQPDKIKVDQAIEEFGPMAVELALTLVTVSDPDGAYTHLEDMGEYEAAQAVEFLYFQD
jgi:hypothetical protein